MSAEQEKKNYKMQNILAQEYLSFILLYIPLSIYLRFPQFCLYLPLSIQISFSISISHCRSPQSETFVLIVPYL